MIGFIEFCTKLQECGVSKYIIKTLNLLYGELSERNREYFCVRMYYMLDGRTFEEFYMDDNDTAQDIDLMDEIIDLLDGCAFNAQAKEPGCYTRCWYLYSILPAED